MTEQSRTFNLVDEINALVGDVNRILNEKQAGRYFEAIALLHGFIEDLLKWLTYTQIMWNKADPKITMSDSEMEAIRSYCNRLSFFNALNVGLTVGVLDHDLFDALDILHSAYRRAFNWVMNADVSKLACANDLHWLVRDSSSVCWRTANFKTFAAALKKYWES